MRSESSVTPVREVVKNLVIGMEDQVIGICKEIGVFKEAK
jgi:hypothetical protein